MVSFHYCMGEFDGGVIYEAPDERTAAAIAFTATSPGRLKETKTTTLMTVEATMEAMRKANAEAYPGPKLWSPMPKLAFSYQRSALSFLPPRTGSIVDTTGPRLALNASARGPGQRSKTSS